MVRNPYSVQHKAWKYHSHGQSTRQDYDSESLDRKMCVCVPLFLPQRCGNQASSWKTEETSEWLKGKDIHFQEELNESELLELFRFHKPQFPVFEVDDVAKQSGNKMLRLLPYRFNPIELKWVQVNKGLCGRQEQHF